MRTNSASTVDEDESDIDIDIDTEEIEEGKEEGTLELKKAIHDDPATMMGNAIQARSEELLQDDISISHPQHSHPPMHDDGVGGEIGRQRNSHKREDVYTSLSYAIGASDANANTNTNAKEGDKMAMMKQRHLDEGGGVEPNSSAVIANYFLKSHGGVHGFQSAASLCSVLFGVASLLTKGKSVLPIAIGAGADALVMNDQVNLVNANSAALQLRLMQRCLICALAKHLSGFIAVATLSASRIPEVGWRETRMRIEELALDPVAQYLFYCALMIVWSQNSVVVGGTATVAAAAAGKVAVKAAKKAAAKVAETAAATTASIIPWWLQKNSGLCKVFILGPILLREIVSTIWVIADVLVLHYSSQLFVDDDGDGDSTTPTPTSTTSTTPSTLKAGKAMIDAVMSILLTPTQWRNATPAEKQKLLAKLVGKTSLGLEVATTAILVVDALRAFVNYSVAPVAERPSIFSIAKRIACARLMINFMLVRKKKVVDLLGKIRGGAGYVPGRVLDCLLEPGKAMGLDMMESGDESEKDENKTPESFLDWAVFLLGF